ncbi:MAG: hypothetical protein WBD10_08730 [Acidobacteriaceae bacterium]
MRRFFTLLFLLVLSIPTGLSITGCLTPVGDYCNGAGYGPKKNQVNAIDLEPKTTGISLSWGQTSQLGSPSATSCGAGNPISVSHYNYGSSNLQLADISPNGFICGGTWNRNSPGGIADYTICTPPAGSSSGTCTASTCGVVNMTVAASGVSSNPVPVYVHPPITSISIDPNSSVESRCYSQNETGPTLSPSGTPPTVKVLGPNGVPINAADVGTITYKAVTASVVNINNTSATGTGVNGATTANMPGSTVINATVSQASSGSAAGYFYTCPPKSITLSVIGNHTGDGVTTPITVNSSTPVNISAIVTDTNNQTINGLSFDYTSTEPQNITVSTIGQVATKWPGDASITAICQPNSCNPAPLSKIGVFGTGTPIVSNTLRFTSPGRNSNLLWMASTQSQFFSSIDLTTGVPGSPVRLPYIPNSMVMDQNGTTLYFGSYRELMIYGASTNSLAKEVTAVPGVVLAVSPDGANVVVNDQLRQIIYLYATASGTATSVAGVATRAQFSPDGKNVYIVGPNALYVHNQATGWSTYTAATNPSGPTQPSAACNLNNNTPGAAAFDPFCGPNLAVTVPSVGPFISGSPTTAWGFCPSVSGSQPVYYPKAASLGIQTDALAATENGQHILGADKNDNSLSDIWVYQDAAKTMPGIPTGSCPSTDPNQPDGNTAQLGLTLATTFNQTPLGITASEIDQVVAAPNSNVAFVTYNSASASGILPAYQPSATAGQAGTLTRIQLSGAAKSPLSGIFSPNETLFFVGTSGDDLVHFIDPVTLQDTKTINPGLIDASGNPVPVQMMAVRPRTTL